MVPCPSSPESLNDLLIGADSEAVVVKGCGSGDPLLNLTCNGVSQIKVHLSVSYGCYNLLLMEFITFVVLTFPNLPSLWLPLSLLKHLGIKVTLSIYLFIYYYYSLSCHVNLWSKRIRKVSHSI